MPEDWRKIERGLLLSEFDHDHRCSQGERSDATAILESWMVDRLQLLYEPCAVWMS
jgi:hypothetical protein